MPSNTYRLEVRLPSEVKRHLEKLRKEAIEKTGKHVSMTSLVSTILEDALKRLPVEELDDEKRKFFFLLSSS